MMMSAGQGGADRGRTLNARLSPACALKLNHSPARVFIQTSFWRGSSLRAKIVQIT
jgi:hypothetical protein